LKAVVDPDICTGCGLCADTCPDIFELDEDEGVAFVSGEKVPEDSKECVKQAEEECPVSAIKVEDK
jgi:ferredoxin